MKTWKYFCITNLREQLWKYFIRFCARCDHRKTSFGVAVILMISVVFYLEIFFERGTHKGYGHVRELISERSHNEQYQHTKVRQIDVRRKTVLEMMCKLYANKIQGHIPLQRKKFDHILVDKKHKLLYCYVPKVASTNWKRMLMILANQANTTNLLDIPPSAAHGQDLLPRLSAFSINEIKRFLKTHTKFLIVRHPFERILSAYHNKFQEHYLSSKYIQLRFGRHIIRHYRNYPSQNALLTGNNVTFQEFVHYLANSEDSFENEHWMPINDLCEPCYINYDIIGKYETLVKDSQHILSTIGEQNLTFPHLTKRNSTFSRMEMFFSDLPKDLLQKLYNIYFMDFKLFQYDIRAIEKRKPFS